MQTQELTQKVRHELIEYAINVVYLAVVFAAFTQYRRFLLAGYDISYTNYWVAVIEALILGKVVMIGNIFRLGRWLEDQPLIYPTIYKAFVFCVIVVLFSAAEYAVKALWQGEAPADAIVAFFAQKGTHEVLANGLVVLVAFIPYFAMRELSGVLGRERIAALFFVRRIDR